MLRGLEAPSDRRRSLGRCPRCASRLIQIVEPERERRRPGAPPDVAETLRLVGVALVDRYCPECEHRDSVASSTLAAARAYRRETRDLAALQALADSISVAVPLAPVACIVQPAEHSAA